LLKVSIPPFTTARVLIIGDVMLDRYWHGATSRISPEAPVPVVKIGKVDERPGGAGNVALNIANLGSEVTLLSVRGEDEAGTTLENKLQQAGVQCHFITLPDLPTIMKLRVLSQHQQMIRLDFESALADHMPQDLLLEKFTALLSSVDVVVISDYGKGSLGKNIPSLIATAKAQNKRVLVDPKSLDFSHYHGASVITPNLKEFEAVVGHCTSHSELIKKGLALLKAHDIGSLIVTRGEEGMTLISPDFPGFHIPARAREIFDVTGAGDTVIAVLAAAMAASQPIQDAMMIANTAAAVAVSKMGTATVSAFEIQQEMARAEKQTQGVLSENELMMVVAGAKTSGEKIIMTNGCFDLLHLGHVQYLEKAKALGDRLIIAVNTDDSVKRLKGDKRPVNALAHRMGVLSALSSADWIVPFDEDTPERLIKRIMPHVLVKGADYQGKDVAGAKAVEANGGEVRLIELTDGFSTTKTLARLSVDEK